MERIGNRYRDRRIIFLADREIDRFDVDDVDLLVFDPLACCLHRRLPWLGL